jgi:hypothetical protein
VVKEGAEKPRRRLMQLESADGWVSGGLGLWCFRINEIFVRISV